MNVKEDGKGEKHRHVACKAYFNINLPKHFQNAFHECVAPLTNDEINKKSSKTKNNK